MAHWSTTLEAMNHTTVVFTRDSMATYIGRFFLLSEETEFVTTGLPPSDCVVIVMACDRYVNVFVAPARTSQRTNALVMMATGT